VLTEEQLAAAYGRQLQRVATEHGSLLLPARG
jgi:hypothetical protein